MQDIPSLNTPTCLVFNTGVGSQPWSSPEQRLSGSPISIETELHMITQAIHSSDSFLQVKALGNLQILLKAHTIEKFEEFLIRAAPRLIELLHTGTAGTSTWILMILPRVITKSDYCRELGRLGLLPVLKQLAENSNSNVSRFICQTLLGMVQSGKGNDFVKDFIEIGLLPWVAEMATSSSEFVSRYAFQLLAAVFTFLEHDIRDVHMVIATMSSLLRTERWETCIGVFSVLPGLIANLPSSALPECPHLILAIVNTLIKIPSNLLPSIEHTSLEILSAWTGEICVDALAQRQLGKMLLRALIRLAIAFEADFHTSKHFPSNVYFVRVCSHLALGTSMAHSMINSGILDVLNYFQYNESAVDELHDELGTFCMYLCSSLDISQMSSVMNNWPAILDAGLHFAGEPEEGSEISLVQFDCLSRVIAVIMHVPNWPMQLYPQISNLVQVLDNFREIPFSAVETQ